MPKPRIYLHIGHAKTGTTSIQTFLLANRRPLREAGLHYPLAGLHDSAHRLLSPAFFASLFKENLAPAFLAEALAEIRRFACPRVCISFEGFVLDNPRSLAPLLDAGDVTVIYYIRRQDLAVQSIYAQRVRSFVHLETRPATLCFQAEPLLLDYAETAARFAAVFGHENIRIRPFESRALHQSDPVADILRLMEFTPPPGLRDSPSRNDSLKRPYLAFKRLANLLPFLEEEHKMLVRDLTRLSVADTRPAIRNVLSPADRQAILDRHQPLNAALAQSWFPAADEPLFRDPPPDPAELWAPLATPTPEEQWAVFQNLSPETQAVIHFLHRPARLAQPGEPLLPAPPDDAPAAFARAIENRRLHQLQRRLTALERKLNRPAQDPPS